MLPKIYVHANGDWLRAKPRANPKLARSGIFISPSSEHLQYRSSQGPGAPSSAETVLVPPGILLCIWLKPNTMLHFFLSTCIHINRLYQFMTTPPKNMYYKVLEL